jgi:RHS repeat-associated protein
LIDLNADWSVATTYFNGPGIDDHLRQTNATTGISYFLTDHLGTTSALADLSGNLLEQFTYDSFGNNVGSSRTRYSYTGRERDPDTGLLYYRARFYDPQTGRFISEDPIAFEAGYNWYQYVENNPISFSDPLGLSKHDRWYGYNNRDFHKWFHRCWKQPGDRDADKDDIEEAHAEWMRRGSPQGGNCWGGRKPDPSACKDPTPARRRIPGPTMDELRMQELSAREKEMFWKKILVGSVVGGTVVVAGPAGIAALLRWIAGAGAAAAPAYAR